MKPVLHYFKLSPNCIKALIALHIKGVDFEPFPESRERSPELRAANPRAKTPTLITDEGAVWESTAIIEYLEETYHDSNPLMPDSPIERARVRSIVSFVDTGITHHMGVVYYNVFLLPPEKQNPTALSHAVAQMKSELQVFEDKILTADGYLCGALTLADMALFPWVAVYEIAAAVTGGIAPFPKLAAWYSRMAQLEAVQKSLPTQAELDAFINRPRS